MSAITAEFVSARRLDLVPLRVGHATEMATVLADPDLYAFTGGSPPTGQQLRARYQRWIAGSADPAVSWCNWVIQLHGQACLAGTVQATISAGAGPGDPAAEVAWIVGTSWQGQGIGTEAARALIAWLERRSVRHVFAHIHPGHHASAGVAAAAGLTPTGHWQDGELEWSLTLA